MPKNNGEDYQVRDFITTPVLTERPKPNSNESLQGYLLRLSGANGYASPFWLRELEPSLQCMSMEVSVVEALTRLTGYTSIGDVLKWGREFPRKYHTLSPRVCILCLKEQRHLDYLWEIGFATVCPYHGVFLTDYCSSCSAPLSWSRGDIDRCKCGRELTLETVRMPEDRLLYLNNKIWAASGRSVRKMALPGFPDEGLSALSLTQICRLYGYLYSRAHTCSRKTGPCPAPQTVAEATDASAHVISMLREWPAGLYRGLNSSRGINGKFTEEGAEQAFGRLHKDLYNTLPDEEFWFLRAAFEGSLEKHWIGIVDGGHNRVVNYICVASSSAIGNKKLKQLGLLESTLRRRSKKRLFTLISEQEVQEFHDSVGSIVDGSKTGRLLGINRSQLYHLVRHNMLAPVVRPCDDNFGEWWFDLKQVEFFLNDFVLHAPRIRPKDTAISFTRVCQLYLDKRELLSEFLVGIRDGTVQVAGLKMRQQGLTLKDLYFDVAEVRKFREAALHCQKDG